MPQQLSLSARPRHLDALVGQQKIAAAIRGHFASGRTIKTWMFTGPFGSGKTTLARILALSYQCTHQQTFGKPCRACYRDRAQFSIAEINAASATGIDKIRDLLEGSDYGPIGAGGYRVYIIDECQQLSGSAQSLLLKYTEDSPDTSIFILCTTDPQRMVETLRSRCQVYELKELDTDEILTLTTRLLTSVKSDLGPDRLADALNERGIRSPRLVCQAVEKYLTGMSPEDASLVEGVTTIDVKVLTRAVVTGNWSDTAEALQQAQALNVRGVRASLLGYFRTMLLTSSDIGERTRAIADAITTLCSVQNAEDLVISSSMAAELYRLCEVFSKYYKG